MYPTICVPDPIWCPYIPIATSLSDGIKRSNDIEPLHSWGWNGTGNHPKFMAPFWFIGPHWGHQASSWASWPYTITSINKTWTHLMQRKLPFFFRQNSVFLNCQHLCNLEKQNKGRGSTVNVVDLLGRDLDCSTLCSCALKVVCCMKKYSHCSHCHMWAFHS